MEGELCPVCNRYPCHIDCDCIKCEDDKHHSMNEWERKKHPYPQATDEGDAL